MTKPEARTILRRMLTDVDLDLTKSEARAIHLLTYYGKVERAALLRMLEDADETHLRWNEFNAIRMLAGWEGE